MNADLIRLGGRLVVNGLQHRLLRCTSRPGRPMAVSIEVTHNCVARCVMCNIWRIPADVPDLPIQAWLALLSDPLLSDLRELDVTGGEPFLRDDLLALFEGLAGLRRRRLPQLKAVAITTNGFLTPRVLSVSAQIAALLQPEGIEVVMVCAMDAVGEIHDRIRRVKGGWAKLNRSIQGLIALRQRYPNLIIGLKTTILPLNVDQLDRIADYAAANDLFTIISPCIITEGRYLNPDRASDLVFGPAEIQKMVRFFGRRRSGWDFHERQLVELFQDGRIRKPCTCGFNYFFVRSNGDLFLCPLVREPIGNIRRCSLEALFNSPQAARVRHGVGRFPVCRCCTEPGLERFSLPMEGWSYLRLLLKLGRTEFLRLHQHMGLDKYVG